MLLGYFVSPAEAGWTSYPPLSTLFSGDGQTLWGAGRAFAGSFIHLWFHQLHRHHSQHAAAGDDNLAHAPALLGGAGDQHHRCHGHAIPGRRADAAACSIAWTGTTFFDAAGGGDVLLWQEYLLVLQPSRRLYHGAAGHGRAVGSALHPQPQAGLRLSHGWVIQYGHRHRRFHGLGASHVHQSSNRNCASPS